MDFIPVSADSERQRALPDDPGACPHCGTCAGACGTRSMSWPDPAAWTASRVYAPRDTDPDTVVRVATRPAVPPAPKMATGSLAACKRSRGLGAACARRRSGHGCGRRGAGWCPPRAAAGLDWKQPH